MITYRFYIKGHLTLIKFTRESKSRITHALPVPVHQEADFISKRVPVIIRLHDTVARSRTGMKLSLGAATRVNWCRTTRSGVTFSGGIV